MRHQFRPALGTRRKCSKKCLFNRKFLTVINLRLFLLRVKRSFPHVQQRVAACSGSSWLVYRIILRGQILLFVVLMLIVNTFKEKHIDHKMSNCYLRSEFWLRFQIWRNGVASQLTPNIKIFNLDVERWTTKGIWKILCLSKPNLGHVYRPQKTESWTRGLHKFMLGTET